MTAPCAKSPWKLQRNFPHWHRVVLALHRMLVGARWRVRHRTRIQSDSVPTAFARPGAILCL